MDTEQIYKPIDLRQSTKLIRKLRLKSHDVVLVKAGTDMAKHFNLAAFSDALSTTGVDGIIVVVVDDFHDIRKLSEKDMRQHGWFKLSSSASAIMEKIMKDKENGEEEENQDDSIQSI